jgi:hypothetical protein
LKIEAKFASIFVAACILVFLSQPAFARAANPPQDQGAHSDAIRAEGQEAEG